MIQLCSLIDSPKDRHLLLLNISGIILFIFVSLSFSHPLSLSLSLSLSPLSSLLLLSLFPSSCNKQLIPNNWRLNAYCWLVPLSQSCFQIGLVMIGKGKNQFLFPKAPAVDEERRHKGWKFLSYCVLVMFMYSLYEYLSESSLYQKIRPVSW